MKVVVFVLTFICAGYIIGCKVLQDHCKHSTTVPVVIIGKDGVPHTVYVPFCDTLQLKSAALPDTLIAK